MTRTGVLRESGNLDTHTHTGNTEDTQEEAGRGPGVPHLQVRAPRIRRQAPDAAGEVCPPSAQPTPGFRLPAPEQGDRKLLLF